MMIWIHSTRKCLTTVYGIKSSGKKRNFNAVVTFHDEGKIIKVSGLLSNVKFTVKDYALLLKYASLLFDKPFVFEVLPSAARLYRRMFNAAKYNIIEETPSKTFDGYDSLLVKVIINKKENT